MRDRSCITNHVLGIFTPALGGNYIAHHSARPAVVYFKKSIVMFHLKSHFLKILICPKLGDDLLISDRPHKTLNNGDRALIPTLN